MLAANKVPTPKLQGGEKRFAPLFWVELGLLDPTSCVVEGAVVSLVVPGDVGRFEGVRGVVAVAGVVSDAGVLEAEEVKGGKVSGLIELPQTALNSD